MFNRNVAVLAGEVGDHPSIAVGVAEPRPKNTELPDE